VSLAAAAGSHLVASPISPDNLIDKFGVPGLLIIIFAECGLLIGFFLPGDTLLFSTGLLIATNKIHAPLALVLVLLPVAALLGNACGYWIGRQAGPRVFVRPNSRIFRPEFVERSQAFFDRWGPLAVIIGRFVPIVRTVVTVVAGVSRMNLARYLAYSLVGAILWTDGLTLLGYWLGQFQFVKDHIEPRLDLIIVAAVIISMGPTAIHIWRGRQADRHRGADSGDSAGSGGSTGSGGTHRS
jgi:membrane-associated protein